MTIHTITIHRALTLISKSNDTINSKIGSGLFVSTTVGAINSPTDRSYKSVEELQKRIQSDTDSVEGTLNLIAKLKTAIAAKNLETFVEFQGKKISITELLAIKQNISQYRLYTSRLRKQINEANSQAASADQDILNQLTNVPESNKANALQQLKNVQSVNIITSNNESPASKLSRLEEWVDFLTNEIDVILSETNLSTVIEYEV